MDARVDRTLMTWIERIDGDLFGFYPLAGSAPAYGVRRVLIPLANWYGTGSGSDLALCRRRLPSPPGRYRSLYHVRQDIRKLFEMR